MEYRSAWGSPLWPVWKWTITRALYEKGFSTKDILALYRLVDWLMMLPDDLTEQFTENLIAYECQVPEDKVTIINRMVLLLFKYIFNPELQHKLPEIFSLLRTLMGKETGLRYLEVVIRYLTSVLDEDELSLQQIKEMAEQAISKETGGYIMTLAERLRKEREERAPRSWLF